MRYILLLFIPLIISSTTLAQKPEKTPQLDESNASPVWNADNKDPEMQKAYRFARKNFRYYWREISWEQRRIIPGLSISFIKAPFSDEKDGYTEHMWVTPLRFDGETITGTLSSQPNKLKSVKEGDEVSIPLKRISDWIYVLNDKPYGGYSVHAIRAAMPEKDRNRHDEMWGLDFGDSNDIRVCPDFGEDEEGKPTYDLQAEHPMSRNMTEKLAQALQSNPDLWKKTDEAGLNWLHQQALAGNTSSVEVLIQAGADLELKTKRGLTALELAKEAGWKKTTKLLKDAKAAK